MQPRRKGDAMPAHTKRLTIGATRALGTRKRSRTIRPRYLDEDVRIFRRLSRNSFRVAGEYIKRLIGSA